jgi:serine phosphatase RsbU (regulator of sigma subunit)
MTDFFAGNSGRSVNEFIHSMVEDVKSFNQEAEQINDITLLIIKRKAPKIIVLGA